MSYTHQAKSDQRSQQPKSDADLHKVPQLNDQRSSTQTQLKQQSLMNSASSHKTRLPGSAQQPITQTQKKSEINHTGLPHQLKAGIESLSGISLDQVKVHYNSSKPAQLQAHAYAQGNDIHIAPGQEQHLPHEAWHVVQQAQGRVKPSVQLKSGVAINNDPSLEQEADVMGAKALTEGTANNIKTNNAPNHSSYRTEAQPTLQGYFVFPDSPTHITSVPKLYRIEGSIGINQRLNQQAASPTEYKIYNWDEAIDIVLDQERSFRGDIDETPTLTVDLSKVAVQKGSSDVTLKELKNESQLQAANANKKRGYSGTAIVWTGEAGADSLADKYIAQSQDWSSTDRKARLAVNFGINNRAEFLAGKNDKAEQDVIKTTQDSFNKTKNKVTSFAQGWTWGYKYAKGGLPKSTTEEIGNYLTSGKIDDKKIIWKYGEETTLNRTEALAKFHEIRATAGAPYGALRSKTGEKTQAIESHLKDTNNTGEVFVHSMDADAPDFSTLKQGDESGSWKKVLDAYDEILDEAILENQKDHDVVIGGYNLLADPQKYTGKDYQYTVQSNVVDLAIRQAIHAVEPLMTYPTEPNFIIRAGNYVAADKATKGNVWGSTAYEGRNFIDNYIANVGAQNADIHYDPLASVPTGVDKGGARLKIETGKKYDENSILGKPLYDKTSQEGNPISLEDQYVVQAQSWAGASRIATAYRSAYKAKSGQNFAGEKQDSIDAFAPVELMVKALVSGTGVANIHFDASAFDATYTAINVTKILASIKKRLTELEKNQSFLSIVQD